LYTYPDNFRAYKALIAAQYSGVKVKLADNFVFGETNAKDTYLKKFPSGKVPAFEDEKGVCLTESNAIAYYVANNQLRGTDDVQKALVQQWLDFADSDILPASCTWVFPCLGAMQFNKSATDRAKEDVKKAMKILNDHLLHHTYLVGERITLADISVCCTMLNLYIHVLEPSFRNPFGNVNRWFVTMVNQPNVKAVIGDIKLCEKMAQFNAKKFAELNAGGAPQKKADEPKAKKKEKEAKPAPAPAAAAEPMEEPKPEKSKDPFATIPKGNFDLDDFKRFYSNNEESKSVPYFWEKFDKEHYSIWRCDYKYCDELTMVFMSCNLIGGMFQRLDKLRKNAFASVCLFGDNNDSTISGIWVWRGHDLVFELSDDWKIDYASYDWKKLDPDSEDTKKMVDQYFKWEGTDKDGRKFNQGKIFK
jgi:elongation factor 1-gamma